MHVGKLHQLLTSPRGWEVLDAHVEAHNAGVIGVRYTVGAVQKRCSHGGQSKPRRVRTPTEYPSDSPGHPREAERGDQRQSYAEPKGGAEIENARKETVSPMGQKSRADETQREQEKHQRQCRAVLECGNAKKIDEGGVNEVMAEEENRQGDEKE